ncbi:MAG: restriction endonuclease, partial [Phototrophicales bacterium]
MNEKIQTIVREAVLKIINDTASNKKIAKLIKTHTEKIHFIPTQYRIFGGVL